MSDTEVKQMTLPLATERMEVHCFFSTFTPKCTYVAKSGDPQEAHDLMEIHYAQKHRQQLDTIINRYGRK